jgi:hypothetical protein
MANEDGNPQGGIGLHEATLAISSLLGPEEDNQEQAEALSQEEAEPQDTGEETETEEYEEYDEYESEDEVEESDLEEEIDEEEEPTQELSDDLTVRVKVDGEEMEVSLAELRNGYSRTADYTRKSTALADQRKQIESEIETIRNERALYQELLPQLRQQIEQQTSQEPDWDSLYNDDPIEAARLERQWRSYKEEQAKKLSAIEAEQKRLSQTETAERQKKAQEFVAAERAKLPEVIPEWKDEKVLVKEADELRKWAVSQGLTEREVDSVQQANILAILRKAMLFDKGKKNVESVKRPANKKGRVVRPGSRNSTPSRSSTETKRASKRLAQTGRVTDAAALIDKLI